MANIGTSLEQKLLGGVVNSVTAGTVTAKYPGTNGTIANFQALSANMTDAGLIPVEMTVWVNAAGTVTDPAPSGSQTVEEAAVAAGLKRTSMVVYAIVVK